jgi:hypothetical protein
VSRRPIRVKQAARVRKALRGGRLDRQIDLVQWLMDRRYASTKGEARAMLLAGRVRSESHALKTQYVSAALRDSLYVAKAETE